MAELKLWIEWEPELQVRVTRAGDAALELGQTIPLDRFLEFVGTILKYGGEMPIAVLVP